MSDIPNNARARRLVDKSMILARWGSAARRFIGANPRRRLWAAVGVSVLAHLLAFLLSPTPRQDVPAVIAGAPEPLTVRVVPEQPGPRVAQKALPDQTPPPRTARPAPREQPPVEPPVLAPPPAIPAPRVDAPLPPLPPTEAPIDMAAMIRANRERRRAVEAESARSANPARAADSGAVALNRNLQSLAGDGGAGGVFQILRIGARTGSFAFNGWRGGKSSRVRREVYEVDAGPDGDVELAMVRKMIELIREDYPGDFRWDSRRQGRVITLSAAPENTAELEDYLMREFFDSPAQRRP